MSRRGMLDAVVAGGGVVGAATALMLAREGLQVALVEPKRPEAWRHETRDLRVYAFAPDNARLLDELGVWKQVVAARAQPYRGMRVWDAAGGDALVFDADALGQPQLGWIVENALLVDALWNALPAAGVRLHCPARIEALGFIVRSALADTPDAALAATAQALAPMLLDDLRQRARRERRRVGAGETMRTTALVHEAFLRLHRSGQWVDELHFLRCAALAMRQALVDHARRRLSDKRGGGRVDSLEDHQGTEHFLASDERLLEVDDALGELAVLNPRLAQVVECRFFGGYSEPETARILGIADRTVRRDWVKARAWLFARLEPTQD